MAPNSNCRESVWTWDLRVSQYYDTQQFNLFSFICEHMYRGFISKLDLMHELSDSTGLNPTMESSSHFPLGTKLNIFIMWFYRHHYHHGSLFFQLQMLVAPRHVSISTSCYRGATRILTSQVTSRLEKKYCEGEFFIQLVSNSATLRHELSFEPSNTFVCFDLDADVLNCSNTNWAEMG